MQISKRDVNNNNNNKRQTSVHENHREKKLVKGWYRMNLL